MYIFSRVSVRETKVKQAQTDSHRQAPKASSHQPPSRERACVSAADSNSRAGANVSATASADGPGRRRRRQAESPVPEGLSETGEANHDDLSPSGVASGEASGAVS